MLGSLDGDACLALPSPFDKSQLDARILPVDLRYAARESSAPLVADAIEAQLTAHDGNAIVFFPSYAYLEKVGALLEARNMSGTALMREARGMTEDEKNALLGAFEKREKKVALLAVLGGRIRGGHRSGRRAAGKRNRRFDRPAPAGHAGARDAALSRRKRVRTGIFSA